MKKWYKESYFDRQNWILENYDQLNLSSDETLFLLLVELAKKNRKTITYDYLSKKLNKTSTEVDKMIADLVSKHYLKLSANDKGLIFDYDEIFEFDPNRYEISDEKDLYDITSDVFNKPLSLTELQKMNDLLEQYGKEHFIEALRIAEAQRKLSMSYIEGILRNDKK